MELLNSIIDIKDGKLAYIRVTDLNLRGNGSDLIAIIKQTII